MAYNPSDPNYYVNVSDPCGQDLTGSQQACGNAQKAYADQQTGQIPTLSRQQEKLGYLKGGGQAGISGGITSAGLGYGSYIGDFPPVSPPSRGCPKLRVLPPLWSRKSDLSRVSELADG